MSRARDVKSRDRSLGSLEMLPRWNFRCFPSAFSLRFSLSVDRRSTSSDKFRGALSPLRKVKSEITLIPSRAIAAKRQLSAVSKPDGISPKFSPSRFSASIFNFASFASRFCARARARVHICNRNLLSSFRESKFQSPFALPIEIDGHIENRRDQSSSLRISRVF